MFMSKHGGSHFYPLPLPQPARLDIIKLSLSVVITFQEIICTEQKQHQKAYSSMTQYLRFLVVLLSSLKHVIFHSF